MQKRLSDKVAFITGGGSWIGKEIATLFASEGAQVFIVGRDEKKLQKTEQEIKGLSGIISYYVADVRKEDEVNNALHSAISIYGKIDILVQNAGIYPFAFIKNMTFQNWKEVIDVNLTGTFLITKSVSEIMKNEKSGRIIFISSIAGEEIGYPGLSHYSASKAGMNGFMRSAALELAPHKITVNSIDPGNIMNTESFPVDEKAMANMLRRIPLGRLGQPLDVANIALFLASDESSFITGQKFVVDGGETISGCNISVDVILKNEN